MQEEAIRQVRAIDAWPVTKLAFELLMLTACRSREIRLADGSEFDLDGATWTIPATWMKNGLEHRVPLSDDAMDVLRTVQELSDRSGLVFPSQRGKTMSDSTLSKFIPVTQSRQTLMVLLVRAALGEAKLESSSPARWA